MARWNALTKCYRCEARYDGGVVWVRGYRTHQKETVPGRFVVSGGRIKMGHCPICDEPPQLDPAPQATAM